jgi:transposase-like protein
MEDYHLPICTECYAVRVEPQRKNLLRPTCMACGEALSRKVRHTVVPMAKSNYVLVTDLTLLKGLNKYVQT